MQSFSPRFVQTKLVSLDDMYDIVDSVIQKLPKDIRSAIQELDIIVDNFPTANILADLGITNKYDLLGLYQGQSPKTSTASIAEASTIFVYRCPILRYAEEHQDEISHLVRQVILYEISHHMGVDSSHLFNQCARNTPLKAGLQP